ncbi:MAG: hypothetical protein ACXVAY_02170 [Mucilaginibacter sp.]
MKTPLQIVTGIFTATLLITGINFNANSQRLNSVQSGGVYAPTNVKIDAKADEWGDFQAYNTTTDVFYTLANDDKNLYLVVKSTNQMINNKIVAGGITFTINTNGKKKKDIGSFVATFPLIDMATVRGQMQARMRSAMGGKALDSAAIAGMRNQAIASAKEIKLEGFKDIPDSVISIYNEYGLKAAVDYDRNGNLVCEMSIPLKYLNLTPDNTQGFAYNIKLNGLNMNAMRGGANVTVMRMGDAGGMPPAGMMGGAQTVVIRDAVRTDGMGGGGGGMGAATFGGGEGMKMPPGMPSINDMQNMVSPTDFWAKYSLAKK